MYHVGPGEHKYHAVKQRKNTINQHNHKLTSAWATSCHHSVARQCELVKGRRSKSMGNGHFRDVRTLYHLNRSTKNLTHVITSVRWPRMPNFIKFGGSRANRQYGEIYTSRTFFYIFFLGDFLGSSTEKSTQQFQALNGLKCSTVGNLGS